LTISGNLSASGFICEPEKRALFATDSYFLDGCELFSDTDETWRFAFTHALLLLKPDAVATRALLPAIEWTSQAGFEIASAARIRLNRNTVRAMWHYQFNCATPQRRRLAEFIGSASDSLVLLMRHQQLLSNASIPATLLLSERKGPSDPSRRTPGQLRSHLGDRSFLINLVHASDEPADLLRELCILFNAHDRIKLVRNALLGTDQRNTATALAKGLYDDVPRRDLEFEPAAHRLASEVEEYARNAGPGLRNRLQTGLGRALRQPSAWGPLIELIWQQNLPVDEWDLTVVGCASLPMTLDQHAPLLASVSRTKWLEAFTAVAACPQHM
jgi:nucleoside diphosphate kinase